MQPRRRIQLTLFGRLATVKLPKKSTKAVYITKGLKGISLEVLYIYRFYSFTCHSPSQTYYFESIALVLW